MKAFAKDGKVVNVTKSQYKALLHGVYGKPIIPSCSGCIIIVLALVILIAYCMIAL